MATSKIAPTIARSLGGPSRLTVQHLPARNLHRQILQSPSPVNFLRAVTRRYASTATATANPNSTSPVSHSTSAPTSDHSDQSSSRQSGPNSGSGPQPEPEPKGAYAKFKALSKKYGWYALGMYTALSSVDFSLSFLLVHTLGLERVEPLWLSVLHTYRSVRYDTPTADTMAREDAQKKEEEKRQAEKERKEHGGKKEGEGRYWGSRTFWAEAVLAYAIHKTALLPFRAGLTVAWTPKVVGWLTRRGWIGKGGFGRAATHAQGKIKDASERVKAVAQREKP